MVAIKMKDSLKKIQKHHTYRQSENQMANLLKVSKQTHYKKYFEHNRKTVKLFWMAFIRLYIQRKDNISPSSLLVNGQAITNKLNIAENFNNFYINWKKLHIKIYLTNMDYSNYL